MQLQDGIEKLIAAMTNEARYYKAIQLRRLVQTVRRAGKHFVVVTDKDTFEADYVLSTLSVGVLKCTASDSTRARARSWIRSWRA